MVTRPDVVCLWSASADRRVDRHLSADARLRPEVPGDAMAVLTTVQFC